MPRSKIVGEEFRREEGFAIARADGYGKFQRMNVKNGNAGFSLIEILLVVFLLGVVIIPLYGYMVSSASTIEEVILHQMAGAVASSQMETYRNQPYKQVSRITGELELEVPPDFRKKLTARLKVQEVVPGKLLQIIISASWTRPKKGELVLATLLANQNSLMSVSHD